MPVGSVDQGLTRHPPNASIFKIESVLGPVLFVATMLFYLVSMTPFVDLSLAETTDPSMHRTNVANQIVFMVLTLGLWAYALRSQRTIELYRNAAPVLVLATWFCVGSVVSDEPSTALKHSVLAGMTCVNASLLLLLPRDEEQFSRLLAGCCVVVLLLSYTGVVFLPHLAIHQVSEVREPMNAGLWRGHFAHKNAASATMVLFVFFGLYICSLGQKVSGAAIIILSLVFLINSGGKTAICSLPCIYLLGLVFEKFRRARLPIAVGGLLLVNLMTLGSAVWEGFQSVISAMGIDGTFTGRTDIWRIGVDAFLSRPIIGHGFQGFWQSDAMVHSVGVGTSWAAAAYNGHNAYLDMALTTGAPGLVLALACLLAFPLLTVEHARTHSNSPPLTRLFIQIWLYGMFSACLESIFFSSGSFLWVAMVMSISGLYYQSRARMLKGPA